MDVKYAVNFEKSSRFDENIVKKVLFNSSKCLVSVVTDSDSDSDEKQRSSFGYWFASSGSGQEAAVTGCHMHGSQQYCIDSEGKEGSVVPSPTNTAKAPTSYTECLSHGSDTYCLDSA